LTPLHLQELSDRIIVQANQFLSAGINTCHLFVTVCRQHHRIHTCDNITGEYLDVSRDCSLLTVKIASQHQCNRNCRANNIYNQQRGQPAM